MPSLPEDRVRVLAIVHALKSIGVRVKNWKNFINGDATPGEANNVETELHLFAFGRNLQLLPQHHVTELDGTVPLFLVETCEYLSKHLHTEGLFRKTGSLSRIRSLRAGLEKGKLIFHPPHNASLQPCDVASLLKQFLRELPQPLIPVELQAPLCQAQTLEMNHDQQGARDRATLLLTALLPPAHARTLRYFCTFLSQVAQRCTENKMEVGNLALVMAPNLLQCPDQTFRLSVHTEKQLDQQAAVIKTLISHADCIGIIPSFVLDMLGVVEQNDSTLPADGAPFSKRAGLGVYRSLRRQRRRSVGEIFVDAFSRLKPGRTPTGPPINLDAVLDQPLSKSPTPQSPNAVKRKASEEAVPDMDGSTKKRRSLHDLRGDSQSVNSHSAEESTGSHSRQDTTTSKEDCHLCVSKRRSHIRGHRKSLRPSKQEDRIHQRRRSLRFFNMSSTSSPMPTMTAYDDPEKCLSVCSKISPSESNSDASLKIPLILIEGPGRVVIGSEVDYDPDLLNCSFAENPSGDLHYVSPMNRQDVHRQDSEDPGDDDRWVLLEGGSPEVEIDCEVMQTVCQTALRGAVQQSPKAADRVLEEMDKEQPWESKKSTKTSKRHSRPRRSISMPEVALEPCCDEISQVQKEVGREETVFNDDVWSVSVDPPISACLNKKNKLNGVNKAGQHMRRKYSTVYEKIKDKKADSEPVLKRTHQRFSVAERLRSFSALATMLRTPRAAPQLAPQKGTVHLRRQGARRFSRSFSHEEFQEEIPQEERQQAFVELTDSYSDSCVEIVQQPFLDPTTHLQEMCTAQSPSVHPSPKDLVWLGSPEESEEHLSQRAEEQKILTDFQSECIILDPPRTPVSKGDELQFDLNNLMEKQCHIEDRSQGSDVLLQSHGKSHNVFMSAHQPGESHNSNVYLRSVSALNTEPQSPQYSSCSHHTESQASLPCNVSPCDDLACLSFDSLLSISNSLSDKCSLSLDLTPPTFHFKPLGSKRHYRDSPRWPSHEVRMSTWKPLPL